MLQIHRAFDVLRAAGLPHDLWAPALLSVTAAMSNGVFNFDELYGEDLRLRRMERDLIEAAARALLAEAPRKRLDILVDSIPSGFAWASRLGNSNGFMSSAAAKGVASLVGEVNRARFVFSFSALPCLIYALDAVDSGMRTQIVFEAFEEKICREIETIAQIIGVSDLIETRALSSWGEETSLFDVAVIMPPLGLHLNEHDSVAPTILSHLGMEQGRRARLSVESVSLASALSSQTARSIICVSDGALFRMVGAEHLVRQNLIESGRLSAVMSVPSGMMWRETSIKTNLVVVDAPGSDHTQVRFVDLGHESVSTRGARGRYEIRGNANWPSLIDGPAKAAGLARNVSVSEIQNQNFVLTPERFLNSGSRERLDHFLSEYETAPLAELVELVRPVTLSMSDEGEYEIYEAAPADISGRGLIGKPARHVKVDRATFLKASNQKLIPGDVVLSIKGNVGIAGIVSDNIPLDDEVWTAGQSLMILREKRRGGISPLALFRYISDPTVSEYLKTIAGGTAIPSLAMKDLKELKIPIPNVQTLEKIAAEFDDEQKLHDQIDELFDRLKSKKQTSWPAALMSDPDS